MTVLTGGLPPSGLTKEPIDCGKLNSTERRTCGKPKLSDGTTRSVGYSLYKSYPYHTKLTTKTQKPKVYNLKNFSSTLVDGSTLKSKLRPTPLATD